MAKAGPPVDPLFLSFQLALAGRYSIDRELGRGGMGVVYLAREVHLDRLVAIKLLPPEKASDASLRERFLREARLAAKLSHPNIIPIHAVDDSGGFVYYVMAFIDGETLAQRVRTRGPVPNAEGVNILREAAWALAYAHGQGLVHRDVKPDNILLESATGRVLVADFGIAAAAGDASGTGVTGTPEFMSPEQALGQDVDARSDLYGLGVTAFYAFSGRLPFEGASATEVLAKQVTEPAPPLASLGLAVPRKVALLIDRCLAKDPAHRPANAEVLGDQLGLALEQRRELPAALRAFVKRNGRLHGIGTFFSALGLLAGATGVSYFFGYTAAMTSFFVGLTVAPFVQFVVEARRMKLLGFVHADLAPAFKTEIEQAREEHSIGAQRSSPGVERALKYTAIIGGAVAICSGAPLLWTVFSGAMPRTLINTFATWALFSVPVGFLSTLGYVALLQRRRDVDTEFWSKLWQGRIGKLAFGMAGKLLGNRVLGSAMTHRATELSLGMAAEQLYESLPAETRDSLGDLPQLLHRLQSDAQLLRHRYDHLHEALGSSGDAAFSDELADLRIDRDAVHGKLGEAVGALETIRLNLLRLHAGSGSVEGLTTHIGLAVEVSAEIERMLAAQEEVERGLSFPRETAVTPV